MKAILAIAILLGLPAAIIPNVFVPIFVIGAVSPITELIRGKFPS
jgi:hypothetical protein